MWYRPCHAYMHQLQDETGLDSTRDAEMVMPVLLLMQKVKVKLLSHARLFATPWTVACTKLLHPRDFQGKNTGVGCHFLLQGIFPTQGSNPGLLHCRQRLYLLSHQGSPHDRAYHEEFKHLGGHESILEELPLTLRLEGRKGTSEEMKPISGC